MLSIYIYNLPSTHTSTYFSNIQYLNNGNLLGTSGEAIEVVTATVDGGTEKKNQSRKSKIIIK